MVFRLYWALGAIASRKQSENTPVVCVCVCVCGCQLVYLFKTGIKISQVQGNVKEVIVFYVIKPRRT